MSVEATCPKCGMVVAVAYGRIAYHEVQEPPDHALGIWTTRRVCIGSRRPVPAPPATPEPARDAD